MYKDIEIRLEKKGEVVVKDVATGYHYLVKGRASGNHCSVQSTSDDEKRQVGDDGVRYIEGTNDLVYLLLLKFN